MAKGKGGKAAKKGGKKGAKKSTFRKSKDVPDWASISCKRSIAPPVQPGQPQVYQTNTLYSLMNTQLVDYPRAVQVAGAFQHFRIKKITLTFKPTFDNFLAAGGAVSKPNIYFMIDKSGAVPTNISLEGMKAMGCKPRQLDEHNRLISWRPSVLESTMYAGGGAGNSSASKYKISPWLTTSANITSPGVFQANGTDHLGVYWFVDQLANPNNIYTYTCEVEVQFEFKKPLTNILASVSAIPSQVALLNDSPDGIVGGADGY